MISVGRLGLSKKKIIQDGSMTIFFSPSAQAPPFFHEAEV